MATFRWITSRMGFRALPRWWKYSTKKKRKKKFSRLINRKLFLIKKNILLMKFPYRSIKRLSLKRKLSKITRKTKCRWIGWNNKGPINIRRCPYNNKNWGSWKSSIKFLLTSILTPKLWPSSYKKMIIRSHNFYKSWIYS